MSTATVKRRRIPGAGLLSMTAGLQRITLITGLVLVTGFVFVAVFAPLLAPYGLAQNSTRENTSSLLVGVPLGLLSGYVGRWVDRVLVLVMDAIYAFPTLLLAIVVSIVVAGGTSSSLGGMLSAAIAITVVYVPQYFRVVRNATVAVKTEPYVDAARVTGASTARIMFRHILSNVTGSLPVIITINAADAILTLAALGFLGFGIEPTQAAEWGYDLNKALNDVSNGIWWTSIFPGTAIVLVVLGMTLVGESIDETLNPLLRTRRAVTTVDEKETADD